MSHKFKLKNKDETRNCFLKEIEKSKMMSRKQK